MSNALEEIEMLPRVKGLKEDGELDPPVQKECCCNKICCILCGFGCATCCCLRDYVCQMMIFAPPKPSFYDFRKNDSEFWRIPLDVYESGSEFTSEKFVKFESKKISMELYRVKTSRGESIASIYMRHPRATTTILFSHANAADLGIMSFHFELMCSSLKANVYAYDYTGYGESSSKGKPSESHVKADAEAAYSHLTNELGVDPSKLILYGQSLGSGPTLHLAKMHKVSGVVIHSGIMSAVRVINPYLERSPWFDVFRNIDNIRACKSPVWIIHGDHDQVIPILHGVRLYKTAPVKIKPWFVPGGDHNDIELQFEQEYFFRLRHAIHNFMKIYSKSNDVKISNPITQQPSQLKPSISIDSHGVDASSGAIHLDTAKHIGGRSVSLQMTPTSNNAIGSEVGLISESKDPLGSVELSRRNHTPTEETKAEICLRDVQV
mmetsp:Transcript_22728/g.33892  ORF Transcript_22728/g.33892 Transcript_22728/m.33892 type:complete len:436 (-) Transcript_22728:117-1424(-)|eukprot:CAMPEP_0167754058 /NCGR_PEP_ID=MMETSP0110_2-20121227/8059_1 /TAXON_ID=629695 /ORGANISM="Gymnochlora sp., Strain CCMP2014" /LENGTH=435 /DNA_ID=CAMNT_0007639895 /DNA_START=85 /DNA_END=1392 /DNA_ORIENTATION=+